MDDIMQGRLENKKVKVTLIYKAKEPCWHKHGDCDESNLQWGWKREYRIDYPDDHSDFVECVKALPFCDYWAAPREWTPDNGNFDGVKLAKVRKGKWIPIQEIMDSRKGGYGDYYGSLCEDEIGMGW